MTPLITARKLARDLGEWRAGAPAYLDLANRIRVLLLDGRLGSGARLPAERELSQALGVSRTTIAAAYSQLRENGYLNSVRGSGSTVVLPGGRRGSSAAASDAALDFTKATCPAYPGLGAVYRQAAELMPGYLGNHGFDMVGLPELREVIAQNYSDSGLSTSPDQIMVTIGAQHALSLLTQTLYSPGERILVEQPTYPHALDTFAAAGARMLALPVTAEEGWNLAEAQLLIRRAAPSLAFLMPDFHNPTGLSMTEDERARLARLAQREGTILVADETTAGLDIDRGPLPALASYSSSVVTLGSLGKLVWGGLRIGWIRGSRELLARVLRGRPALDLGTPLFEQLVATLLLREPDLLTTNRTRDLRRGRDHLAALLRTRFPDWSVDLPNGGMTFWINTRTLSTSALALAARAEGLAIVPGPRFGLDGAFERFLRLPFSYGNDELSAGVDILRSAADRVGGVPLRVPLQAVI
ncbi:PLP-dependent aminotransferase family protein [Paenarthrobacter sp. Z7-10]|uniref:MocR-like transcription factor YczR n=1 Tax=Paenarthrobacter sp. Z7-10 TaxID=2787635 RepID=UPI0022A93EDF|nr:PLP-dependent aminotransferase family protein [Paenarthrobacter sp. Z7-10]MCZ2404063.1 PLP-dependent aminotransferase family protein [Paenarthrobacter sp. Z7-10]